MACPFRLSCGCFERALFRPCSSLGLKNPRRLHQNAQNNAGKWGRHGVGHLLHLIRECTINPKTIRETLQSCSLANCDTARLVKMRGWCPMSGKKCVRQTCRVQPAIRHWPFTRFNLGDLFLYPLRMLHGEMVMNCAIIHFVFIAIRTDSGCRQTMKCLPCVDRVSLKTLQPLHYGLLVQRLFGRQKKCALTLLWDTEFRCIEHDMRNVCL